MGSPPSIQGALTRGDAFSVGGSVAFASTWVDVSTPPEHIAKKARRSFKTAPEVAPEGTLR